MLCLLEQSRRTYSEVGYGEAGEDCELRAAGEVSVTIVTRKMGTITVAREALLMGVKLHNCK